MYADRPDIFNRYVQEACDLADNGGGQFIIAPDPLEYVGEKDGAKT